jgi:hypothetical protein
MYLPIGLIVRTAVLVVLLAILGTTVLSQPTGDQKVYASMTAEQRRDFVKSQVADVIGIGPAGEPRTADVDAVVSQIDALIARKPFGSKAGCRIGADLHTIIQRAKPYVPTITASFDMTQVQPDVGIYLAWVESEFCPCLQAPTGPLGMFQFTTMTARNYGIDAVAGASPAKPDERCNVKAASRGAAIYVSTLIKKDFPDDPQEILLAVAAYNLGEGGLRSVRREASEALKRQDLGFWELSDFVLNKRDAWVAEKRKAATGDEERDADLPRVDARAAFRTETVKYVPRFLAAAVIGRNPRGFGINAQPLTKSN